LGGPPRAGGPCGGRAPKDSAPKSTLAGGNEGRPQREATADRAHSPNNTGSGSPTGHARPAAPGAARRPGTLAGGNEGRPQREATADRALSPGTCAALGQALVKTTVTS